MVTIIHGLWDEKRSLLLCVPVGSAETIDAAILLVNSVGYGSIGLKDRITLIPPKPADCVTLRPIDGEWIPHIPCHHCRTETATLQSTSRYGASYRHCQECSIYYQDSEWDKGVWTIKSL